MKRKFNTIKNLKKQKKNIVLLKDESEEIESEDLKSLSL